MNSSTSLNVIIIEKNASLRNLRIKQFNSDNLYKKCGFKRSSDFVLKCEWDLTKVYKEFPYIVQLYAKSKGRANNENKYEFPPPVDKQLFFGSCALIAYKPNKSNHSNNDNIHEKKQREYVDLNINTWNIIYERLFGGFEDLKLTEVSDELEIDELENIPQKYKTKEGYLKDGFIVESNETINKFNNESDNESETHENCIDYEEYDSELSEEPYI